MKTILIKNQVWLYAILLLNATFVVNAKGNYKYLEQSDVVSASWEGATINNRQNKFEIGVVYPLYIGGTYYEKGISIPIKK